MKRAGLATTIGLAVLLNGASSVGGAAAAAEIEFGNYYALVIGIADYSDSVGKLRTAVNDAVAASAVLEERYGFQVKRLLNPTRHELVVALNNFRKQLTPKDNLLIYYAGHGILDDETDTGYWLPVDAEVDNEANWFSTDTLTRNLRGMTAKHVMVVADSCYSGRLVRAAPVGIRSGAERLAWLKRMSSKRARTALVSGGLEPVLDGGGGDNSIFSRAFLDALAENDQILDGHALFAKIRGKVVVNANQTPEYSDIRMAGHDGGEFLFVPKGYKLELAAKTDAPAETSRTERASDKMMEQLFWESIKDSKRVSDYEAYLTSYPNGVFAPLVRVRIQSLKSQAEGRTPRPKRASLDEADLEPIDSEFVTAKNTNVRGAPSLRAAKVGFIQAGVKVAVLGKVRDANWYMIETDDGEYGYIYAAALETEARIETAARVVAPASRSRAPFLPPRQQPTEQIFNIMPVSYGDEDADYLTDIVRRGLTGIAESTVIVDPASADPGHTVVQMVIDRADASLVDNPDYQNPMFDKSQFGNLLATGAAMPRLALYQAAVTITATRRADNRAISDSASAEIKMDPEVDRAIGMSEALRVAAREAIGRLAVRLDPGFSTVESSGQRQ